jgi:Zn-dependent M28 family amino/carboxypeptidase
MAHVATLASPQMKGRLAGTKDEQRALAYVVGQLDAAGISPPKSGRMQWFPFAGKDRGSANAYGLVPGSTGLADEYVVLGAHVDHLGIVAGEIHAGAEDNATGVALVLEVGKALARRRAELGRSVVLAFFGAEESGKIGSRAYVAEPPLPLGRTVAMVNVDMIGLPLLDQSVMGILKLLWGIDDERSVGIVGTEGRPGLRALVNQGCRAGPITSVAPEDFPGFIKDMINEQALDRSDDTAFRQAGVPSVFFSSSEADSYHSADDKIEDVAPEILAQRAVAILETVLLLSRADWSFIRSGPGRQ